MSTACSDRSSACTCRASFLALASGSPQCSGSSTGTAVGYGRKACPARAPPSTSPWDGCARERARRVNGLPDEVHRFLSLHIESVEELEVRPSVTAGLVGPGVR